MILATVFLSRKISTLIFGQRPQWRFFSFPGASARGLARQKVNRPFNEILHHLFVSANWFSKSQRAIIRALALALMDFADDLIHFQKNDFCAPPNPIPKIIFLNDEIGRGCLQNLRN